MKEDVEKRREEGKDGSAEIKWDVWSSVERAKRFLHFASRETEAENEKNSPRLRTKASVQRRFIYLVEYQPIVCTKETLPRNDRFCSSFAIMITSTNHQREITIKIFHPFESHRIPLSIKIFIFSLENMKWKFSLVKKRVDNVKDIFIRSIKLAIKKPLFQIPKWYLKKPAKLEKAYAITLISRQCTILTITQIRG